MSRIKTLPLACLIVALVALTTLPAAAQDADLKSLEEKIQSLEGKITSMERSLNQRLANIERMLKQGAGGQAANPLEGEAQQAYAKISRLAAEGKMDLAKKDMSAFMQKYASTNTAKRARSLNQELAVIGKNSPTEWGGVEKWYQGESDVDLASDKATLLVFWETWCPHCQREVPKLQALHDALSGDGLQVVGLTRITKSSTEEKVTNFIGEQKVGYPVAKEDGSISQYFNVSGIPAAAVIKGGKVVWRGHPARLNEQMLRGWL